MNPTGLSQMKFGTKISLGVSFILVCLLLAGAVAFIAYEYEEFNEGNDHQAESVLGAVEAAHIEAMLNRGDKKDTNPVMIAFENMTRSINRTLPNVQVWLVMGPKVQTFQEKAHEITEYPRDDIDRKAIETGRTISSQALSSTFRLTRPVILGEGSAADAKCAECHTRDMDIQPGEVIGAYSFSLDTTQRWNSFLYVSITSLVGVLIISVFVAGVVSYLLRRTAGTPIAEMTAVMNRLAKDDLQIKIPSQNRSDEIGDMARALKVFKEIALSRQRMGKHLADSERRFGTVLNHMIDGVIIIDEAGTVRFINPAAENIFGRTAREVLNQNVNMLMPEPYRSEHDQYLLNYLRTDRRHIIGIGREVRGLRRDGSSFPMELSVSEFYMNTERQFVGLVRDITERNLASAELLDAKIKAEAANASKSEFLANMSHELRTPLNAIIGFSEAAIHGVFGKISPPQYEEYLTNIHESGGHLLHLISQILDLSRVEQGNLDIDPEDFILGDLIEDIATIAEPLMRPGRNAFRSTCPDGISMHTDPTRVRQIILNVIGNAAKFTDHGKIDLVVQTELIDETPFALITIEDTGVGITEEQAKIIFRPFVQADLSVRKKYGGTGLGLSISHELSRIMGGDITVSSEAGQGSVFTIRLPLTLILPEIPGENA